MIIIAGHEVVPESKRDAVVERFTGLVSRARAFDGCLHFAITADSVAPERINTVEIWRDEDALNRWREQANAPDAGEITSLDVKRYNATDGGPL